MTTTTKYRLLGSLDANGRLDQSSYDDQSYVAEIDGFNNPIYQGYARPGLATSATGWKIKKNTYDINNIQTRTQWPQNSLNKASNDYEFIWDNRALYTFS